VGYPAKQITRDNSPARDVIPPLTLNESHIMNLFAEMLTDPTIAAVGGSCLTLLVASIITLALP
jgi:hypothetical protein